jgi:hypothetical protein
VEVVRWRYEEVAFEHKKGSCGYKADFIVLIPVDSETNTTAKILKLQSEIFSIGRG